MDDAYPEMEVSAEATTPDVQATNRLSVMEQPRTVRTLNVERAQHILNKFTTDPSWLADPRTSRAANSIFSAASKVIGMNIQLERVNNQSQVARSQQLMLKNQLAMVEEVAKSNPEAVAHFYVPDEQGNMGVTDLKNMPAIAALHKQYVAPKDIQPKAMSVTLGDGTIVQGVYNPATGAFQEQKQPASPEIAANKRHTVQLEREISALEKQYVAANADYLKAMAGKKTPDTEAKGFKAKADYYRAQQKQKQDALEKLRTTPEPAATQKRVRVIGPGGKRGTVVEGESLPEGWSLE